MGLGVLEIILILVVAVAIFLSESGLAAARSLLEVVTGKRKLNTVDWRMGLFTLFVTASLFTLIYLQRKKNLTDQQMLTALGVLCVWALTWWFCFGIRKED